MDDEEARLLSALVQQQQLQLRSSEDLEALQAEHEDEIAAARAAFVQERSVGLYKLNPVDPYHESRLVSALEPIK